MNPDHLNKQNQPRERSIPITTTQGNLKTTHFPGSSSPSSSHSGATSGPFSNSPGRGSLFDKLNHFRDQHNDEMFSDRSPFSSFGYPSMSSGSRNVGDFFSHNSRDEEEDCEQESQHQPRVFNIPIQVETPEGVVPLSRSSSHSPSFSQFRNNTFATPSYGGGPVPERTGDSFQSRQRPGPSPTPPPKPKFTPSYKPESQGFIHQQQYHPNSHPPHQQPHRVHKIPVQVEKSFKPSESVSNQNVPDSRFSAESSMGRDSPRPESQQSGNGDGPHVINIPINNGSKQSSENKSHQQQSSQPAPNQSKTTGETPKGSNDPIDIIADIKTEVSRLENEVNNFDGESQKQYRYLDEMLTRCMLKLDNIESNGRDEVRSARKSTLAYVDHILALLDSKRSRPENEGQMEATEISDVQQPTEQTPDSMEDESVEVDSNLKQESTIDENIAESSESENTEKSANQMEIESESVESKKQPEIDDEQPDEQLEEDGEEDNGEAIEAEDEEDPTGGVDGSSKDFYNCSNNQLSNENICRTNEAVIIEEMDKEEPPKEPPIEVDRTSPDQDEEKVNILELNSSERHQQQIHGDGNGSFVILSEPKIELASDDDWDSSNNNHQHDHDLMRSVESLVTLKPNDNKVSIVMESDGSNASDDNLDSQPFVEMPDESSISSKDSDETRESFSNHNMQSSSPSKKPVHA